MQHQTPCTKILLAGNAGCRVTFCEAHETAELEIGAFSLRLDTEIFCTLNTLINEAMLKINTLHASKESFQTLMQGLLNKH